MEHPQGLTSQEATKRLKQYGKNTIEHKKRFVGLKIFVSQFPSLINGILLIASLFFFFTGDLIDAIFILAVILLNSLFGFFQEFRAEKAIEKLKTYSVEIVRVFRDGEEQELASTMLVPGDIVVLTEGERLPADGTILEGQSIEADEAILTGESLPVAKNVGDLLYSGTLLTKGKGLLQVEKTGNATQFGEIATTLAEITTGKTPLQRNITTLGKMLSIAALGIAILIIPVGLLYGHELIPIFLVAMSVGIAAVPEGLPAVITIALAIGTNRMAKRNAIIRKMPAVETLGATQVLLVDKTGTLTQNTMRVKKYFLREEQNFTKFIQACVLGNTASLAPKNDDHTKFDVLGDTTDGALLLFVKEHHKSIHRILETGKVVDEFVFDVTRKTITTVWEHEKKKHVFVRGAPEVILAHTTLTEKEQEHMTHLYEQYAKEGLRVIAFASKIERYEGKKSRDDLENKLTFLGFVGIYDPPRPGVAKAIETAHTAGIRVLMVTGDNEYTALAIGKEIGLIAKDEDVITGEELSRMSDEELKNVLGKTSIFARTKPQDKLRLATLLKEQGFVVGVTGDGVNDALALKKADVGVAMGESGTDVAKEASDVILADDNFTTLINAVGEGRVIYRNIVKAVTYLVTGNLSELALVLLASALGLPIPLLPTQILWINLATDGLPALALATDNREPAVLNSKPRDPKDPILTHKRMIKIFSRGMVLAGGLVALFYFLLQGHSQEFARTIVFNVLILSHLTLAFIIRGQSIFRVNKFLVIATIITVIAQIIITTTPAFQHIFHLEL